MPLSESCMTKTISIMLATYESGCIIDYLQIEGLENLHVHRIVEFAIEERIFKMMRLFIQRNKGAVQKASFISSCRTCMTFYSLLGILSFFPHRSSYVSWSQWTEMNSSQDSIRYLLNRLDWHVTRVAKKLAHQIFLSHFASKHHVHIIINTRKSCS
jgi:hypothetical protein